MARVKVESKYKKIVDMFGSLTGSRALWGVYQDCIEMFAISIQNSIESFPERYKKQEERYLNIAKQYSSEEMQVIAKIFAEVVVMLDENPYQDLLGGLYMQLDMGSDALGQFFTPYSVSKMMAQCVFNEEIMRTEISEKGYITINEPCIGGGANVIAFLETMWESNINYQRDCIIVGQDLSRMSALMAYIVLSLIGARAVIKIGDTLSDPYISFFEEIKKDGDIWYTPMLLLNQPSRRKPEQRQDYEQIKLF